MKEQIIQNLGQLRSTTGRSDLIDPITAEIVGLERQIDEAHRLAGNQESLIEEMQNTIALQYEVIQKYESRNIFQRIINKVL